MFCNFFWKLCHSWYNVEKYGRTRQATDENIIRHMCIACWITKATDIHSEYSILMVSPWQWSHKHASKLCYIYSASLVSYKESQFCWGNFHSQRTIWPLIMYGGLVKSLWPDIMDITIQPFSWLLCYVRDKVWLYQWLPWVWICYVRGCGMHLETK
jgi:hypothetical protein